MFTINNLIKVSVIQATPVVFDLEKTLGKTIALIRECSKENPDLILFPGSFIPAYPRGLDFGAVVGKRTGEGRMLWQRYWENSVEVPGKQTEKIGKAAKEAKAYIATEGQCFVLGCNQYVEKKDYPADLQASLQNELAVMSRGGSVIISPFGETLAGPLWDGEGILSAELNLNEITRAKMDPDVAGHYARPDLFEFGLKVPDESK